MARSFGYQDERLTQSALAEQEARTRLTNAQISALAQELGLKKASLDLEAELGRGKLQLGGKELTSKEGQAQLAAAVEALGLGSKESIAANAEKAGALSDLTKRPDVPLEILARAMAGGGQPELFNALAADKAQKREKLIQSTIPLLQSAKSDAEREKKIKPALEALGPGTYAEALARAFPKAGQEVRPAAPETYPATPTTNAPTTQDRFANLADRLLSLSGLAGGEVRGGATAPTDISGLSGADYIRAARAAGKPYVEGGLVYNQPSGTAGMDYNVSTGEWLPATTVGTINGRPAPDVIAEGAVKRGVSPEDTASRLVYNRLMRGEQPAASTQLATNIPVPTGITDLIKPPDVVTPSESPVPNPNPTPTPTAAQLVQAANANAQPDAAAVEEARQRALRQKMLEELLKQAAQNQSQAEQ